jgi:hypothetical protein
MLYVAFFKIKPGLTAGSPEIVENLANGGTREESPRVSRPSVSSAA